MSRFGLALAAIGVAGALLVPASVQATPQAGKLAGTVGPGFTITLKSGGKTVKTLKAGAYTITVKDLANNHNFHIKGPGVNKDSGVAAKGTKFWKVTLKKGTYRYVCDPHPTSMKGSFKVT